MVEWLLRFAELVLWLPDDERRRLADAPFERLPVERLEPERLVPDFGLLALGLDALAERVLPLRDEPPLLRLRDVDDDCAMTDLLAFLGVSPAGARRAASAPRRSRR
jgi:hypothetical protein